MESPNLYQQIYNMVSAIPFGKVASYSQVARAVGMPRGAQVTGWALGALPENTGVPWWRVVNKQRQLTIVNPKMGPEDQRLLLEKEGRSLTLRDGLYSVEGDDWWDAPVAPPRSPAH